MIIVILAAGKGSRLKSTLPKSFPYITKSIIKINNQPAIMRLIKQFSENHCLGTIALKKMKKNSRYDSFKLNSKKLIIFNVKNKTKNINSGICIFSKKIFPFLLPKGSLEKDIFPILKVMILYYFHL